MGRNYYRAEFTRQQERCGGKLESVEGFKGIVVAGVQPRIKVALTITDA